MSSQSGLARVDPQFFAVKPQVRMSWDCRLLLQRQFGCSQSLSVKYRTRIWSLKKRDWASNGRKLASGRGRAALVHSPSRRGCVALVHPTAARGPRRTCPFTIALRVATRLFTISRDRSTRYSAIDIYACHAWRACVRAAEKSEHPGYHSLNMHISDILAGYARIYLILTEGMPFFLSHNA